MLLPEKKLLAMMERTLGAQSSSGVKLGIGDDCALLTFPTRDCLATVDRLVDGVHFDCAYATPEEIGHKAMAVNLSDIAAMGGVPRFALVSLGLTGKEPLAWIEKLYAGMRTLSRKYKTPIVGGNITRTPKLTLDVVLLGSPGKTVITRSRAAKGDIVCVTGTLGAAAAGLAALQKQGRAAKSRFPFCTRAQLTPVPRLEVMQAMGGYITSAIDLSDGLYLALQSLAEASRVGLEVVVDRLPVHAETRRVAQVLKKKLIDFTVGGGEEYEILMTVRPKILAKVIRAGKAHAIPITPIGLVHSRGTASFAFTPPVKPRVFTP